MNRIRTLLILCVVALAVAAPALAQTPGGTLAEQNLRPYWHVFAAYAIAWLLIGGWVISIARRLGRLEKSPPG